MIRDSPDLKRNSPGFVLKNVYLFTITFLHPEIMTLGLFHGMK